MNGCGFSDLQTFRGYSQRKKIAVMRDEELVFIGMVRTCTATKVTNVQLKAYTYAGLW